MTQPKITKEMILERIGNAIATCKAVKTGTNTLDLLQDIKSYLSQDEWLPIESAPKEHGARFLTYSPDVGEVVCDRYMNDIVLAWNQRPYMQATHWQPLPKPPTNEGE